MKYRILGGAIMLACVLLFQPGADTALQRLWLPLCMGVSAALLLHNALAVLATGALLGLIRTDLAGGDWISATAYPIVGGLCALAALWILVQRYRRYMVATREARAAQRRQSSESSKP